MAIIRPALVASIVRTAHGGVHPPVPRARVEVGGVLDAGGHVARMLERPDRDLHFPKEPDLALEDSNTFYVIGEYDPKSIMAIKV